MRVLCILILFANGMVSQESFQNFGNLKIHSNGALGFHHNLINNGSFDENSGLAGFFSDNSLIVMGALRPIFNDMEVMVENDMFLDVGIGVKNNLNFIDGNVITPRNSKDINIDFIQNSFYSGESTNSLVDGYSMMSQKEKFIFPIGQDDRLQTLTFETEAAVTTAKSAYFFENPDTQSSFITDFDTENVDIDIKSISNIEFWDLDAQVSGRVELFWDDTSNIGALVDDVDFLTIVGWSVTENKWKNLGVDAMKGDLDYGRMVSNYFDASEYSILTFGGNILENENVNYLITPNNDGVNDFLVLKGISRSPNNQLKIFNRWGRTVYIEDNYTSNFNGKANTGLIVKKGKILPVGLYFYTIELKDIDEIRHGYLYINE